jgi:hypothetical protein
MMFDSSDRIAARVVSLLVRLVGVIAVDVFTADADTES